VALDGLSADRVRVAVPGPVRRLWSYTVPTGLREACRPGTRVLVPFGGRKVTGVVVGFEAESAGEADPAYAIKPVERVLDEVPALDAELLELTRWAAEYYGASWGEMIRTALPGQQATLRFEVALTVAGREAIGNVDVVGTAEDANPGAVDQAVETGPDRADSLGETLVSVLQAAGTEGTFVTLAEIRRRTGSILSAERARALARRGYLSVRQSVDRPGPEAREETWVHRVRGDGAPRERGTRQKAVLAALDAAADGMTAAALRAATGAGAETIRTLERRGLVRIETRVAPPRRPPSLEAGTQGDDVTLPRVLTGPQSEALAAVGEALAARRFESFLLFGVTGSGKTEVYLRAVDAALQAGRGALYLVPEIGLTPLLARQMRERFGKALALFHSGLTEGERQDAWREVREGRVRVVLGARSAVFAPLRDLGLVVVDEEHDSSYKQDEHPRYNGRDLAIVRARGQNAVALLGSATPSVESWSRANSGKHRLLRLEGRVGGAALPRVTRVDMRREFQETGRDEVLSRPLRAALEERLGKGEQSLVLLNRRGFSTFAMCRACGKPIECRSCSIGLTLHRRENRLRCHYCNASERVPVHCPECGGGPIHFGGTGTERLEETVKSLFPRARVARMDRDTVRGRGVAERLLLRVERGEVDILLGTQMIAKGHDFPNVTLVGVVAGDALLGFPDFRAGERTFQLLAQVAGRSGRRATPGEVIVQAFDPDHHAVRAACDHDYEGFAREELRYRRNLHYPPYSALALLVFRDADFEKAGAMAARIAAGLRAAGRQDAQILGPAPAPLERLRGQWRVQVLIKGAQRAAVQAAVHDATARIEAAGLRPDAVAIDVDPVSTL
jgi:primosomal protein N' (replication factor Y) (superfamily II helicase)